MPVVRLLLADRHLGVRDQLGHVLLGNRRTRHAPVLTALAQRLAHQRGAGVEEADVDLRHQPLQLVVGAEREVHALRVGTDEDMLLGEHEVNRLRDFRLRLLGRQFATELPLNLFNPCDALHRVHPALGHQPWRAEEYGADAADKVAFRVTGEYLFS